MKKKVKRSSDILLEIANQEELKGALTYQRILQILGERAFGLAVVFFALPSALPFSVIPGISFIFSVPIVFFACQMICLRKTLWLPKIIGKRAIHHENINKVIYSALPYLVKIEYFLKPRMTFMTSRLMEIANGFIILLLAFLLMLPIPLSNFIFAGLLIFIGLGLIEEDGLFIILGYIGVFLYISFIYLFIMEIIKYVFN